MKASKFLSIFALFLATSAIAATITSSVIIEDSPQKDGRRWVRERHTFSDGIYEDVLYMAEAGANANSPLAARAVQIAASRTQREADAASVALAEKTRATELLKLSDSIIAAILMVPTEKVAAEKTELETKTGGK